MTTKHDVVLVGGGGHAKVVADALLKAGYLRKQIRIVDQDASRVGHSIFGIVIELFQVETLVGRAVHICIGNNAARRRLADAVQNAGATLISIVHPTASIGEEASLGAGVFVAAHAVVAPSVTLGDGVIVNHGAIVDHDTFVGRFSHVAPQASLAGGVSIGDQVLIGAGANVLPQVLIGDNAMVGAGAAVIDDVQGGGTVVGVPAKRQL